LEYIIFYLLPDSILQALQF